MNNAMGPGVEIEDDIIRLRRRKLEYEADAARRTGPRRLRIRLLGKATPAVSARAAVRRGSGGYARPRRDP
jgi:hypothetical protein